MEYGILLGVIEEGWAELEPNVMRPSRTSDAPLPDDPRRWFKTALVPKSSDALLSVAWTSWAIDRTPAKRESLTATMAVAEEHAREACRRLAIWGCPQPARVVWSIEHEPRVFDYARAFPFRERADKELGVRPERLAFGEHVTDEPPRHPPRDQWRFAWLRRAKRDLVRSNVWLETQADAAANPFAPLLAIWSLGHALVAVVDDAVVLAAEMPKH